MELHGDIEAAERYADEAIRISKEAGIEWNVSVAHEMKGLIALHRKEYDEARTLFEKVVHAYRETGASFNVIIQKSNLAHMERELGNYAIALREKGGTQMTPDEQVYFDEQLSVVREKLDPRRYESIWSTGRKLSMEQGVEMALHDIIE